MPAAPVSSSCCFLGLETASLFGTIFVASPTTDAVGVDASASVSSSAASTGCTGEKSAIADSVLVIDSRHASNGEELVVVDDQRPRTQNGGRGVELAKQVEHVEQRADAAMLAPLDPLAMQPWLRLQPNSRQAVLNLLSMMEAAMLENTRALVDRLTFGLKCGLQCLPRIARSQLKNGMKSRRSGRPLALPEA